MAVPVFRSSDLLRSLSFYTRVLEFALRWPEYGELALGDGVVDLVWDGSVVPLSVHMGERSTASTVNLDLGSADEVDAGFVRLTERGLDVHYLRVADPELIDRLRGLLSVISK